MMTPYRPIQFGKIIAYMLQNVEYNASAYLAWLKRTKNFKKVMYRRPLDSTKVAKMFWVLSAVTQLILYAVVLAVAISYIFGNSTILWLLLVGVVLVTSPAIVAFGMVLPLVLGQILVISPKEKRLIAESAHIFAATKATKIAVAGSYGKTSMKEMLAHVLGSEKLVAVTPANKNVASSHAAFARKLQGNEDVIALEYGEGKPGDVASFNQTFQPQIVVITGIAPAHLDHYASTEQAALDIFSATKDEFVKTVYVNAESTYATPYIQSEHNAYSRQGMGKDFVVSNVEISQSGVQFRLQTKKQEYVLHTELLGRHCIGPIVCAVALAEELGLSKEAITNAIATLKAYEHRMQPRMQNGALIIDDTYNGNIEGMAAGLALLQELPANRKIYVTPGLVDQGKETEAVHIKLGELIAHANPSTVVLMKNSVQSYIAKGMQNAGYNGEVRIEDEPLKFYTQLDDYLAAGDIALLQNDWPDNYA